MRQSKDGDKSLQSVPEFSVEKSQLGLTKGLKCEQRTPLTTLRLALGPHSQTNTHTHAHAHTSKRKELCKYNFILILGMLQTPVLIMNVYTSTTAPFASLLHANDGDKIIKK